MASFEDFEGSLAAPCLQLPELRAALRLLHS